MPTPTIKEMREQALDLSCNEPESVARALTLLTLAVLEVADRLDGLEVLVDTVALPPAGYH